MTQQIQVRKLVSACDEVHTEEGPLSTRWRRAWAAAVIQNPWIGENDDDLISAPAQFASALAAELTDTVVRSLSGEVVAYGKGGMVGSAGAFEHIAAVVHTPYFAGLIREITAGSAVISFADARSAPGETLTVPLCDIETGIVRSRYETVPVVLPDAPLPDELVLVVAGADGARPRARVGDRTTDPKIDYAALRRLHS